MKRVQSTNDKDKIAGDIILMTQATQKLEQMIKEE